MEPTKTLNVRGVDVEAANQLKAGAALRGLTLGKYLALLVKLDPRLVQADRP